MNSFYKTHLQAFNVISIVLYHSSPKLGQVLYSCQDAFIVDASDYLGHLIRHLLIASEAFPMECFLQIWEQVKVQWCNKNTRPSFMLLLVIDNASAHSLLDDYLLCQHPGGVLAAKYHSCSETYG